MRPHDLQFPATITDRHLIVLGITGSGKSYGICNIVENLLIEKKRVVIVDPKGDWHGLSSSADGKSKGLPVVLIGDFKDRSASQIPIDIKAGREIASLVTSGNHPVVIGFRGWMPEDRTAFWVDFASELFNTNSAPLHLVIDEVHNFTPKGKVLDVSVGKSIHWTNRLAAEGRGIGIRLIGASQRPQKVHNDFLTSCPNAIFMRVVHPADRKAISEWVDECGNIEAAGEVIRMLPSLKTGQGVCWIPEIDFRQIIRFEQIRTFDGFAEPDERRRITRSDSQTADIESVREKLSRIIEQQKANDPATLRAKIAELERELRSKNKCVTPSKEETERLDGIERDIAKLLAAQSRLTEIGDEILKASEKFREIARSIPAAVQRPHATTPRTPTHPAPARRTLQPEKTSGLPEGEMACLKVVAQHHEHGGATSEQVTLMTGYKRSTRDAYLARLRNRNLITSSNGQHIATEEGIIEAGDFEPMPHGDALIEFWRQRLPEGERVIFTALCDAFPGAVDREEISRVTGFKRSTRDAYLSRLATRNLLGAAKSGMAMANPKLF